MSKEKDEEENILDSIFNSLNKKDRKELFAIKDGVLTSLVSKDLLVSSWRKWNTQEVQENYKNLTTVERKKADSLSFIDKVNFLIEEKESTDVIPEDLITGESEHAHEDEDDTEQQEKPKSGSESQKLFTNMVNIYLQQKPHVYDITKYPELEIRFGTRGIKRLTKSNYDNVVQVLKSFGYQCADVNGSYTLKIQNEFIGRVSGRAEISSIRAEIQGLDMIHFFCKTNNLKELIGKYANSCRFLRKSFVVIDNEKLKPVNFDDFNFRVSLQNEDILSSTKGSALYIINNWKNQKKIFRYVNRVSFFSPDSPVKIELSLVKSSDYGKTFFTTDDAGLFQKPESVEIEIEVDNKKVGPGTNFNDAKSIQDALRKACRHVLFGLQQTKYPISYPDQKKVQEEYMKLVYDDEKKNVTTSNFIGPSSLTLQRINIAPLNENSLAPNIRKDYTVTDKADGLRHLLFVNDTGKIYLINTSMNIIFTGAKTNTKECFNTLADGELIIHNKSGKFINLFAVFDIYFFNKKNIRALPLIDYEDISNKGESKSRLGFLTNFVTNLKAESILTGSSESPLSPIRIELKQFYPANPSKDNIFGACDSILGKEKEGLFEYNVDGLIFTPAFFGVGGDAKLKTGPLSKSTWEYSFKQKPQKYLTIDFLVTTVKTKDGIDEIKTIFEEGTSVAQVQPLSQYKTVELRVTFVEKIHGFLNPCQDIIDENYEKGRETNVEPKPVIFYPTNPYDPDAGIANIMLRMDESNTPQMFTEEGDVFGDNTIVEFSYDFNLEKGWRWVPLRLRHDKTSELHQGYKNFGNAYHVANSNWQSMHNPITEEMICTGQNIPEIEVDEDIYYNYTSGTLYTEGLRNFHNLFVKKNLIKAVCNGGDTLIDFACGKAGDLSKWIAAKLSFVFGIDISKDNLENRLDGACARYLNAKRQNKDIPYCLFVNGNSAFNIKNGSAMRDDKAIQITKAIFGEGSDKSSVIGKGVARHFGVASEGFNAGSCQFALHYFFKDPETLKGFMRNLVETIKINGFFVGTAYDGKLIFKMLQRKQPNESVQLVENDKKIWEVVKRYSHEKFDDSSASLGYQIDVYQESINQLLSEYLINFDYLNRVMENYGFTLVTREEAKELGLPEGTGLFNELFSQMMEEETSNRCNYGKAPEMKEYEKKISFLNRYFIYKKVRNVNASRVILETEDFEEKAKEEKVNPEAEEKEKQEKLKESNNKSTSETNVTMKKLKKKLLIVPSNDTMTMTKLVEKAKDVKPKRVTKKKDV